MSLATEGFSAMMSALGWSTEEVLELLLEGAFATRLPKFELKWMILLVNKECQFNLNLALPPLNPLFYY